MSAEPPRELSPEVWEKKAKLSLREGNFGEAMKYAHYANLAEAEDKK